MERRIVLLGKTGSGKSATGNTILNSRYFEEKLPPVSMTKNFDMKEVGRIAVIDTPGMFDTSLSPDHLKQDMDRFINMSLIKLGRFMEEEKNTVKWNLSVYSSLYNSFGLFTHTDQLGERTLVEFLAESLELRRILITYGNRYHGFNNNDPSPAQVERLMEKKEDMVMMNEGSATLMRCFRRLKEFSFSSECYKAPYRKHRYLNTSPGSHFLS